MTRLSNLSRSLNDKVAIVTGAASGMGRATAFLLADEGASVAVVDLDQSKVDAVVNAIQEEYGAQRAIGFAVDVRDSELLLKVVESTIATFGSLDIVVNNAGISLSSPVTASHDDFLSAWDTTLAINLSAYVHLVRAALPHLKLSSSGRIVNVASTESIVATPTLSAYSASKSGVTGLTRSLAVELGKDGITVNCICPGPINTGMTEAIPSEMKSKYANRHVALRRYGEPEEVAQMTVSLCMPAMSFVTGATIVVDGGMTIRHT
jgi:3-oxoacyl-[acyl-carrier protein] reductase